MKFFCRACRYTSCIRAGMVMSRNALATARKAPNNIIPREPTPRSVPSLEEVDGFSKILNISNGDLLKYYVKEVESIMAQQRYGEQKVRIPGTVKWVYGRFSRISPGVRMPHYSTAHEMAGKCNICDVTEHFVISCTVERWDNLTSHGFLTKPLNCFYEA